MFKRSIGLAAALAATVSAGFDAASSSNVAIYWGQGDAQITLPGVCSDPSFDIVNLAFINEFPTAVGQYPGSNFANACEPEWYTLNGIMSKLNSNCPLIGPGIQKCHDNEKKVFLSLGGGVPTDYSLPSREIAEYFADFLWGAYGPLTPEWKAAGKPRPFGDVSVDGFDLDLEALIPSAKSNEYQYINYNHFVNRLKSNYASSAGKYYISGAPQCITPDVRMSYTIQRSHFDFLFVQFYNTAQCNTRRGYESLGHDSTDFTFESWVAWVDAHSANQDVKIYLGMPASVQAVPSDPSSYLTPTEAEKLINAHRTAHPTRFGGVMLWEATKSKRNPIYSKPYATHIRSILDGKFTEEVCSDTSPSLPSPVTSAAPSPTAISLDGSSTFSTGTGKDIVVSSTSVTAPAPTGNSSSTVLPGTGSSAVVFATDQGVVVSQTSTIHGNSTLEPLPTGSSSMLTGTAPAGAATTCTSSSVGPSGAFLASPQSTHGPYANTTHPTGYEYIISTTNGAVQSNSIPFASSIGVTGTIGQADSAAATSTSTVYTRKLLLTQMIGVPKFINKPAATYVDICSTGLTAIPATETPESYQSTAIDGNGTSPAYHGAPTGTLAVKQHGGYQATSVPVASSELFQGAATPTRMDGFSGVGMLLAIALAL